MKTDKRFSFQCQGLPEDTFVVVSFTGSEGLSMPYEFSINLASSRTDVDLDQVTDGLATLSFLRDKGDLPFHGIVTRFEQLSGAKSMSFYRAILRPRFWALSLTRQNRVFVDASAPEFLAQVLQDSKVLSSSDFEFRLSGNYPAREFVCQYMEPDLAFVSRWMEREGMYYFFEQQDQGEKLVITDSYISHQPLQGAPTLEYRQVQGMNFEAKDTFVHSFVCEQNVSAKTVTVRDYNYRMPNVDISGQAEVAGGNLGEVYIYGDNVKSQEEAKRQATFRAQEALTHKKRFRGNSTSPFVRSGCTFQLSRHFRKDANRDYLAITVHHEGQQTGYLITVFGRAIAEKEIKNFYRNSFVALPADVQYRHPRETPKPRFHGLINAVVDASGEGQYAVLDDKGRYKVRLPFDLSGRPDGMASSWIRMAQPYGGAGHGMHFPLLKGTEVLLDFIDGDVDRPVIAHAVPNFEQNSIVQDKNAPANAIKSAGGNQLVMGDKRGQEFIGMFSPFHKSGIAVGSMTKGGGGSISLSTEGDFDSFSAGAKNEATFGASNGFTCGVTNEVFVGLKNELTAAINYEATLASKVEYVKGGSIGLGDESSDLKNEVDHTGLQKLTLSGGVAAPLVGLISTAKSALAAGMIGTAVAGAGIVGMSAPYDDGFLRDASLDWKDFSFKLGLIGAISGTLVAACSAGVVQQLVENFEKASEKAKTANMVLDKNGIQSTVNCAVGPSATWKAEVTTSPVSPALAKSNIEIAAMGADITLDNKSTAKLKLSGGNSITMEKVTPAGSVSVKVEATGVTLTKPASSELKVDGQGVTMAALPPGTGGQVKAASGSASMTCGNDSIKVTPTGLQLSFLGNQLHAGPLMINPAGIIQLG